LYWRCEHRKLNLTVDEPKGDRSMGHEISVEARTKVESEIQPLRDSYDSGYEHSGEHWVAIRQLVEEAD